MRIFPEGATEWLEPCGKAFLILGCFALVGSAIAFLWRWEQWTNWPRTQGTVVVSYAARHKDENGDVSCGLFMQVQYVVGAKVRGLKHTSSSSTADCAGWERRAEQVKNQTREVLYDPVNPYNGYLADDWPQFFLVGIVMSGLGIAFTLAGTIQWKIGRAITRRGIELP